MWPAPSTGVSGASLEDEIVEGPRDIEGVEGVEMVDVVDARDELAFEADGAKEKRRWRSITEKR